MPKPLTLTPPQVRAIQAGATLLCIPAKNPLGVCDECWLESTPHNYSDGFADVMPLEEFAPYLRVRYCEHKDVIGGRPCAPFRYGEKRWVRETYGKGWHDGGGGYTALRPTGPQHERPDKIFYKADFPDDDAKNGKRCWQRASSMPRWASRHVRPSSVRMAQYVR